MKTVIFDSEELLDRATAQVKALLDEKPDAVLALSAGEIPMLTLALKPGADVLDTALELVEDLRLRQQDGA